MTRFRDRVDAGDALADELERRGELVDGAVVLGLPRGGVVVAGRVAARRGLDLDVLVARKVGAPGHEEFGIGAVAEDGATVLDDASVRAVGIGADELASRMAAERARVAARVAQYRAGRGRVPLTDRVVIVVDDGFATGVTSRVALAAVATHGPRRVVLAVPAAAPDIELRVGVAADAVVTVTRPAHFRAVGECYDRFGATSDEEVVAVLATIRTTDR